MDNVNVLLISFYFPPYNRVGGRRWAKHCKYLKREGFNINVLCKNFENSISSWDKDTFEYKKSITRIKLQEIKTPYFKKELPKTILSKILWKLSLWKNNLNTSFNTKSQTDISAHTVLHFFEAAKLIIVKEVINTVILSVGPYRYSAVLVLLKKEYPRVKFILDDRDYWNEEFQDLDSGQVLIEKRLQKQVISSIDLILTPYLEMKKYYERDFDKTVYHLPHCFDRDDFSADLKKVKKQGDNVIRMIYGGAFYPKLNNTLKLFNSFIEILNNENSARATLYVSIKGFEEILISKYIERKEFIDSEKYFTEVMENDYVLLFLPPHRANTMSSKFFELVAMRKPILYFGDEGEVSNHLIGNKLGFHITANNIQASIQSILKNRLDYFIPDMSFDLHQHSFEFQIKKFIKELKKLHV